MSRVKEEDKAVLRLLHAWEQPADAGEPIGVLTTTFTLDTAMFEEECLARFLGVQSHPTRDGALYRLEREERLAKLVCATVIADIHHCGGPRSLRWDLLPARPARGVMHAKVSVLYWQAHLRVIVASANMTPDGYRRNRECFSVLDFPGLHGDRTLVGPLVAYLRGVLALTPEMAARDRSASLLSSIDAAFVHVEPPTRGLQRRAVLVGPGQPDVFEQLKAFVPGIIDEAHIVSPFFDKKLSDEGPEKRIWELMRKRGDTYVCYHVGGERLPEGAGWKLQAPAHLAKSAPRSSAHCRIHPIELGNAQNGAEHRPLHAKTIYFSGDEWALILVGSSNFSTAGTGLGTQPNWEANVAYLVREGTNEKVRKALDTRGVWGGDSVGTATGVEFAPAFDEENAESQAPALPAFFAAAQLMDTTSTHFGLSLTLTGKSPDADWIVSHEGTPLLDRKTWETAGQPVVWSSQLPRSSRAPSALQVVWKTGERQADWPVTYGGAQALPPPDGLPEYSLAALLDLLASGKPLHVALRDYLKNLPEDDDADPETVVELLDPHAKVDTSTFLVKRVQRACWAMVHLRRHLCEPVSSEQALAWRLNGPVGARALLKAIQTEADPRLPDELAFMLCEFSRELRQVHLQAHPGARIPSTAHAMLSAFQVELLAQLHAARAVASSSMQTYLQLGMETESC
jgi:hypothetical protein